MKKKNTLGELIKLAGMLIIGWILWLLIFSITITPDEVEDVLEPFRGASLIFGLITGFVIWLLIELTSIRKGYQNIKAKESNIRIVQEREKSLLDKANRVVDKYLDHEKTTFVEVAKERSGDQKKQTMVGNVTQFQQAIENYPQLKANESVMKLLEQITDCDNTIANFKISYNDDVANYNATIHNIPTFIRKITGLKDAEFYNSSSDSEEITDEMLGI